MKISLVLDNVWLKSKIKKKVHITIMQLKLHIKRNAIKQMAVMMFWTNFKLNINTKAKLCLV